MRIAVLTNEYPPHVYGGAGVHVEYLTRELSRLDGNGHQVMVHSFGDQVVREDNLQVRGVDPDHTMPCREPRHRKVLDPMMRNLHMAGCLDSPDIIHCHTWYTHWAGCLARKLYQVPLVLSTHSLEPHRPWKREQLGTGYDYTVWLEQTAYRAADGIIAVSAAMERDVVELYNVDPDKVQVIYNGIDVQEYQPIHNREVLEKYGIEPELPYVLFVGRITRQKGVVHLLRALPHISEGVQIVLCASSPDTEAIKKETEELVNSAKSLGRHTIVWIQDMVPRKDIVPLYSQAGIFVCPSIYEPFGIINLEAMACGTPVVGSRVGGIAESVVHGQTGLLVPFEPAGKRDSAPKEPDKFARDLAESINRLMQDASLRKQMGEKARKRTVDKFGWNVIAEQTLEFYQKLITTRERRAERRM